MPDTPDVVDLITADHREVERLFGALRDEPERRALLLPQLASVLTAHSRAEEAEVYPVARREAAEPDDVAHGQEEHEQADALLAELVGTDPGSGQFPERLSALVEAVSHHIKEEESTVLPGMRRQLDQARLVELGEAFTRSRRDHLGDDPGAATVEAMRVQAQNLGITGTSSMGRDELAERLRPER